MLTQLSQLTFDTDGRYASMEELQFLKDYLKTSDERIKVYKKIRDSEAFLIEDLEEQTRAAGGNLYKGSKDVSDFFKRDQKYMMKIATAAMLFNDLDFLREGELLWHRSIMKAVGCEQPSHVVCQVWPGVLNKYLSPDEW
ncbi:MAG: allophycocyanin, partial [Thermosynechococcaceae cyanobacterium]